MTVGVGDTIQDVLLRLYPRRGEVIAIAPPSPPDVFAGAAYLLQISGAYHHVQPQDGTRKSGNRVLYVTQALRDRSEEIGRQWQTQPLLPFAAPPRVRHLWSKLWNFGNPEKFGDKSRVFRELSVRHSCPSWWMVALELMMISDCAVKDDVGWKPVAKLRPRWLPVQSIVRREVTLRAKQGLLSTIAFETNQDIANVLPKARTPGVGCTLRSLSHHLALLPPRGVARGYWISPLERPLAPSDALNLLIVPFPYAVRAKSFESQSDAADVDKRKWGWFDVKPTWLTGLKPKDMAKWVDKLIAAAEFDCGTVHGVVLPEMALGWPHYRELVRVLKQKSNFEILISGLVESDTRGPGNFVGTTMFGRQGSKEATRIREKHHRWKMDNAQITRYALSSSLSPSASWWEKLDILSRSLDIFVFRRDSSLTTLICEDLARVDPSQELVRSIGPNLVVALLMDSAQIKDRWPARYATVLADDPGSSVLTVTSKSLVSRANDEGGAPTISNAIALWRDDTGTTRSIELPDRSDAVLVTLAGHHRNARTLDGRVVENSMSWRYHGQQPISLTTDIALKKRIKG